MNRLAIEISDAGLVVTDEQRVIRSEPAYALVDGKTIVTGEDAYAEARLKPRSTSWTHWSSLSVEPGSSSVPGVATTAELAYAQLSKLWSEVGAGVDQVVFIVPGHFNSEALGVLLGLAEECGIPTGAIVDAAVAASDRAWPGQQLVYVDAGLNSVSVTPLVQGDRVTAETPLMLDSMGLHGVMDTLARRIGELFVLETRFDPFHEAQTEQKLYEDLPDLIRLLDSGQNAKFSLNYDDRDFEIEIEPGQVLAAPQGFYRAVRQLIAQSRHDRSGLVMQISHRLMALPGIETELARLDAARLVELAPGHAGISALSAADALSLESDNVTFFRHMPWRGEPVYDAPVVAEPATVPEIREDERVRPTHVVYRGVAYRINGEGVVIGRSVTDGRKAILVETETQGVSRAHCELTVVDGELELRDLSSYGTFVNERRIEGSEILNASDTIRIGSPGAELIVIRLEESDGS